MTIHFSVIGRAMTQGSKKVVPIMRAGKPVMKNGRALTRAVEDNPKTAQWRQEVAQVARQTYDGPLLVGAVRLSLIFFRPRPKGHFGTGRNAGKLKANAPAHPTSRPDLLKLARALEDACTGVLWVDDSQIVEETLAKRWGHFQVSVIVESLDGQTREE